MINFGGLKVVSDTVYDDGDIQLVKEGKVCTPGISVIIPVYNTEKYLDDCLKSIITQSYNNIEIICVDDGSTDNSLEKLKMYAEHDDRIYVFTEKNRGQSIARNNGIKRAKGKYIYFMDSDDVLEDNAFKRIYDEIDSNDLDLLLFDGKTFKDINTDMEFFYIRKHSYEGVFTGLDLFKKMVENREYYVSPCIQLARLEFLTSNELYFEPGIIHEDNIYTFKAMLKAGRVKHISDRLYLRRVRKNSTMTSSKKFDNVYGLFICIVEIFKYLEINKIDENYEKACVKVLEDLINNARIIYFEIDFEERESVLGFPPLYQFIFKKLILDFDNNDEFYYIDEFKRVNNSISYKLGLAITYPLRKIYRMITRGRCEK
jgi:glycosyltransferase involved in cell wall biosynthesis